MTFKHTPETILAEIKRSWDETKKSLEHMTGIERNVAVGCEKADLALWAIAQMLHMLKEQAADSANEGAK